MLLAGIDHGLQLERGELDLFYHVRWELQVEPDLGWFHTRQGTLGEGYMGRGEGENEDTENGIMESVEGGRKREEAVGNNWKWRKHF